MPEGFCVRRPELAFSGRILKFQFMDAIKEAITSGNVVAWILLIILLILFIKLLKSVGKGILLLAAFCIGVFLLAKYFPGVAEPITDFIRGSWMSEPR